MVRQQVDCAVLRLSVHEPWVEDMLQEVSTAMSRIRLHRLDWELFGADVQAHHSPVNLDIQIFARSTVSLRRYDVCVLPVSMETLGWTRLALAAIPRGPFIPLVGLFHGLKSAAMQDLLELGLADFINLPVSPDECRARILNVASHMPRALSLREPSPSPQAWVQAAVTGDYERLSCRQKEDGPSRVRTASSKAIKLVKMRAPQFGQYIAPKTGQGTAEPFRDAKAFVVAEFEKEYITHALERHQGNIAMAARAASKHRRAFWQLMRKHNISADLYRQDTLEDG